MSSYEDKSLGVIHPISPDQYSFLLVEGVPPETTLPISSIL
ncbi:hypothetical protein [uncultured Methanobrevibacter sp.]|nr:hypothetical protein [uncultured Methanobrevibacter sp.]